MTDDSDDTVILDRTNWRGLRMLFAKEVRRFSKVWGQTVVAPLVTNSLYFLVFGVALGSRLKEINGVPYIVFVVPGLMTLAMIRNSFLNASSSLFQSKINGTIIDILIAPIGVFEFMVSYVAASVLRGLIVGTMVYLVAVVFVGLELAHPWQLILYAAGLNAGFGCLGIIVALWARKFDHLSVVPSFILTPLIFLGGVFYSVDMLPKPWDSISRFDPMLYFVNGVRFFAIGQSEVDPLTSVLVMLLFLGVAMSMCVLLFRSGYNLRS